MKRLFLFLITLFLSFSNFSQNGPLKIGVIGLSHSHVNWIFNSEKQGDFIIVGIVEPNRELARRYAYQYDFSMDKVFSNSEELLQAKTLDAVTAFGSIYDHLAVVQTFAPKGIHIMVEKPLAVSLAHAREMEALANKHKVHLLTNYETTWYPSNHEAYDRLKNKKQIGELRRVIVRDGHKGPKKIGVNSEFLEWLTDPKQNGGGAITDFGCYGANLLTWLMENKKPISVTAVTHQLQKENNPKVDDDATIILKYDNVIAILEASWNWPIGRKDMEIYGIKGAIYADNKYDLRIRTSEGYDGFSEEKLRLKDRAAPFDDPFSYLAGIINGSIKMNPYKLSSLENNMIVMEILDAARKSANTNKTIFLDP